MVSTALLTLALFFPVVAWSIQPRSPHGPHRHRSLKHAHSAKERARFAVLRRQNPNATDEACGACVTAEDNLVNALNALVAAEEELRAAEGEAQNKTGQFAANSAALTTCTGTVSDVKQNIRSHLDAVQAQVTSILTLVEDDDPAGALVALNAGLGAGLADVMNLWETEKESCDNMAATADTSHAEKAEADDLVEAKLAAAQDANASKVAAETEALDACEAMRAMGYGAPTQAPTAPPTQASPTEEPTAAPLLSSQLVLVKSGKTWHDAEANCVSLGGHLVSIHSKADMEAVVGKATEGGHDPYVGGGFWIGLSDFDTEGQWTWSDGTAVDYEPPSIVNHNPTAQLTRDCWSQYFKPDRSSSAEWRNWECGWFTQSVCRVA